MPAKTRGNISGEADLLQRISTSLPEEMCQRYHELVQRRIAETLSPEEHQELGILSDAVELHAAQRLKQVAELAELRGHPLGQVFAELGLRTPP